MKSAPTNITTTKKTFNACPLPTKSVQYLHETVTGVSLFDSFVGNQRVSQIRFIRINLNSIHPLDDNRRSSSTAVTYIDKKDIIDLVVVSGQFLSHDDNRKKMKQPIP